MFCVVYIVAPMAVPAWVVIIFVALGEMTLGVVLFLVLRRVVLTKSEETANTYQPAPLEDISNN